MKVVYVAGGSYKSFYINYYLKENDVDLLIFNYGIIYNFYKKNDSIFNQIKKELQRLAIKLKGTVAAIVEIKSTNKKLIIATNGNNLILKLLRVGLKLKIENNIYIIGDEKTYYKNYNKIILTKNRLKINKNHCSKRKIYLFCDIFGVTIVKYKKMSRKFNKYSKFILK